MIDVNTLRVTAPAAAAAALIAAIVANLLDGELLKRIYGIVALFLGAQIIFTTARAMAARSQARERV
jgi:uncharacterized membrane protein YfcA